jgi:hypothetical protein
VHIYIDIHKNTHIYIHIYRHTQPYTYMFIYLHTHKYTDIEWGLPDVSNIDELLEGSDMDDGLFCSDNPIYKHT